MGIRRESDNEGSLGKFMTDADGNLIIPGKQSTPAPSDAASDVDEKAPESKPSAETSKQGDGDPRPLQADQGVTLRDTGTTEADKGYS